MTERKPVEISDEDWANTPSTVRGFVSQSITRLEQLEAQFQMVLSPPQIASSALLLSPLHIFARAARSTGWLFLT